MGWSVKLVYTAGVRTGVHMFAICVKTGIKFKMRNDGWVCSFRGRDGNPVNSNLAYSISTHRDPRTSLAKAGMGMDGNHANSTYSHMTARLAQHRRGGDRNPYRNSIQHTAYSIQRDTRTFEFAAGMGMDGNHGNSTCTHQHLASQRNSIYSTISWYTLHYTLHFQPAAALHLKTRRHQHVRSFDTDSVQSDFLLLFFTYRCPIYQTLVDTICEETVAPRFSSSSS
jgi:hypothetical protein